MSDAAPRRATVRVPATSANLGPGYDSFGLALGMFDEVSARRTTTATCIEVSGCGQGTVPRDTDNLVVRAASAAFAAMGEPEPNLHLRCTNTIPHGSGLGSSAAAVVTGILLARALTDGGTIRLSDDEVFQLATGMEGHPDNVAPALFGGFTIAWQDVPDEGMPTEAPLGTAHAVPLQPHPEVVAHALIADQAYATSQARAMLPAQVPHADAARNAGRAGLLVHALTQDPTLLPTATQDWLHQPYRMAEMPETDAALRRLRSMGLAALLSGAGPSILVLSHGPVDIVDLHHPGFRAVHLGLTDTATTVRLDD